MMRYNGIVHFILSSGRGRELALGVLFIDVLAKQWVRDIIG